MDELAERLLALAMTCRFSRHDEGPREEDGDELQPPHRLLELRENRNVTWHTFGWYCWSANWRSCRVLGIRIEEKAWLMISSSTISDGAVYEGDLGTTRWSGQRRDLGT